MSLTHDDVAEIIRLIETSRLDEMVIEVGDVRIQALAAESLGRTKALAYVGIQPALAGLLASGNFMVRYKAALAMFAYGDNGGAATMAADAAAGPADQRKLAAQAYTTLTANGNG